MSAEITGPDMRALREHLGGGRFQSGADAGRWRLVSLEWPVAVVTVAAAPRPASPAEFTLRFELSGYPNQAPTGGIWDLAAGQPLPAEQRPKGERAAQLFRTDNWVGGATAMYAPWDRIGLQAHADWPITYPYDAWTPARDLSFVLSKVHEVLNADDYLGI
jgi:hypothetical protein